MSILAPELEPVFAPKANPGKPKKIIRGARRRVAKAALQKLSLVLSQDEREIARGERYNYDPLAIAGSAGSADKKAFQKVIDRLSLALEAMI